MKTIIFSVFLLSFSLNLFSQDLIFFNNAKDTIKCKIIKDKVEFIEYNLPNDSNIYRIYQEQYDYYIQNNEIIKKQDSFIQQNNNSKNVTTNVSEKENSIGVGLGFGLDYGGLGLRIAYPLNYFSVFVGFGYDFIGLGYNIGLVLRPFPKKILTPIVSAMYGANALIYISGADKYNKIYNGYSIGLGAEIRLKKTHHFIHLGLNFPFFSNDFNKDFNDLKSNPTIVMTTEPNDVLFTTGFTFNIK